MLPSLPSLAPRDSYNLWYTPTHHPNTPSYHDNSFSSTPSHQHDPFHHTSTHTHSHNTNNNNQNHGPQSTRRPHQHAPHRTPLSRLVADEIYQARRKSNIQNYGNSWLRPPGIPKSLFQIREEEREYKEHREAMRREALAQELADAEAAAVAEEDMEGEDEMEEMRDLDDDIPEGLEVDEEEDEEEEVDDEEDEDEEEETEDEDSEIEEMVTGMDRIVENERRRIVAQHMADGFGIGGLDDSASEEGDDEQMLQEEDLVHEPRLRGTGLGDGDTEMGGMDMDADLDDDVPEAQLGGYEHTDTEEECSSSEDESYG